MSTSLTSLVNDVITLTNRPDLVGETTLAVKAATLKAHQHDDWIKDLTEYSVNFGTSDYFQSLDYKALIPLWRKPRYIRKYDATAVTGGPGDFFTYIVPEKVVDEFGANRTDIFYVAGANIQLRSSTQFQYALLSAYLNPDITGTGYSSWIADDHPFAVIYEAAAIVFKSTGYDEMAVTFRDMVKEQLADLTKHAVTGTGM